MRRSNECRDVACCTDGAWLSTLRLSNDHAVLLPLSSSSFNFFLLFGGDLGGDPRRRAVTPMASRASPYSKLYPLSLAEGGVARDAAQTCKLHAQNNAWLILPLFGHFLPLIPLAAGMLLLSSFKQNIEREPAPWVWFRERRMATELPEPYAGVVGTLSSTRTSGGVASRMAGSSPRKQPSSGKSTTPFVALGVVLVVGGFLLLTAMKGGRTLGVGASIRDDELRQVVEDIKEVRRLVAMQGMGGSRSANDVEALTVIDRRIDGKPLYLFKACPDPAVVPTSKWSCIRRVSEEDVARRDPSKYGFQEEDWKDHPHKDWMARTIGIRNNRDPNEDAQIATQIHVTSGPGYGLMDMPRSMYVALSSFYKEHKDAAAFEADGNTTSTEIDNGHLYPKKLVVIGVDDVIFSLVDHTCQGILEQWTQQKLKYTALYGIRVYPRNSVLINHVDARETHIASAILQVAQQTDAGWPLELIEPDGSVIEVYMQPGQMLLYEGSRVPHGRPRRSEGDAFANVFVHYKPRAWNYDEDVAREMAEEVVKRVQRGRQDET